MLQIMASSKRALVVAGGLVLGAALAFAVSGPVCAAVVRYEAKKSGVELTYVGSASYGLGTATLKDVRFSLVGAPSIVGGAAQIDGSITGGTTVHVTGMSVVATGPLGTVVKEVSTWAAQTDGTATGTLRGGTISWSTAAGQPAVAQLSGVDADPRSGGFDVNVGNVTAAGNSLGSLILGLDRSAARTVVAVGARAATQAPIVVTIDHVAGQPAKITAVAKSLPVATKVLADATVTATLPDGATTLAATVTAKLKGYVPPHPAEVNGIVFGNETDVSTDVRFVPGQTAASLENLKVVAGALTLTGKGDIQVAGTSAAISAGLDGSVPCSAAAKSMANSTIGGLLGNIAGSIAQQTVSGSVAVHVQIDADARDWTKAKVATSAVPRCSVGF